MTDTMPSETARAPRPEKIAVVDEVKTRLQGSSAALLTEYRGMKVADLAALRVALTAAGADFKVYKNTLVRFAVRDLGLDLDEAMLTGPTAIAFVDGDAAAVAKALRDYARTNPLLIVKGGILGESALSADEARALADLPSREVLLARFAGGLAAPLAGFAGLLQALPRNLAYGLKALIEQGGAPGAPAAGAPAGPTGTAADAEAATGEAATEDVPDVPASTDETAAATAVTEAAATADVTEVEAAAGASAADVAPPAAAGPEADASPADMAPPVATDGPPVADVAVDLADAAADVAVPTAGAIDAVLPDDPSLGVPDAAPADVAPPGAAGTGAAADAAPADAVVDLADAAAEEAPTSGAGDGLPVADAVVDLADAAADVAVPTAGAIDAVLPDDPSAGVPVTDVADAVVTAPGEVDHAPEITDPAPADVATTDAAPAAEAPTTNTDTPEEAN